MVEKELRLEDNWVWGGENMVELIVGLKGVVNGEKANNLSVGVPF